MRKLLNKLLNKKQDIQSPKNASIEPIKSSTVQSPPKPPVLNRFNFNVAGTTAKNDEGKDLQKTLQSLGKKYCSENDIKLYGGYSNRELISDGYEVIEFEDLTFYKHELKFEYEPTNQYDKNAIKVFVCFDGEKFTHVGYVPKTHNVELKSILENEDIRRIEAKYVGGNVKNIEYDDEKEKDVIVVNKLNIGIEIDVYYI